MKGENDSPSWTLYRFHKYLQWEEGKFYSEMGRDMLKKQFLKTLSRVGGNPSPVPTLQQGPSAWMDGQCWGSPWHARTAALAFCVHCSEGCQAGMRFSAPVQIHKLPKPSPSANATNPKAKYRA